MRICKTVIDHTSSKHLTKYKWSKSATRVTAHSSTLIDHVYTNQPDMISECLVPAIALSDHYPACFTRKMTIRVKKHNHNSIRHRSYIHFHETGFLEDSSKEIEKFKCSQENSNFNFNSWKLIFTSVWTTMRQ